MAGINQGDNRHFEGFDGQEKKMYLSSWYMQDYFGEKKLLLPAVVLCAAIIVTMISAVIGGVLA
jgi:ech hydrogenase subunit A